MCIRDSFKRGIPDIELKNGLLPTLRKNRKTGTKIYFLPDSEIFEKTRFKEDEVISRLHETAYLNPELTIIYDDLRENIPEHLEFHEPDLSLIHI